MIIPGGLSDFPSLDRSPCSFSVPLKILSQRASSQGQQLESLLNGRGTDMIDLSDGCEATALASDSRDMSVVNLLNCRLMCSSM
jgi:hypothetical protein